MTRTDLGAGAGAGAGENTGEQKRRLAESNRARVAAMYQGRPDHEKFMAIMMLRAMNPEDTAGVLDMIRGAGTDLEKRMPQAGNRPLRHFVNKDRNQLRRELGNDEAVEAVLTALADAGMKVSGETQRAVTAADETETRAARPTRAAQPTLRATGDVIGTGAIAQRAFGKEQVPADEIWHLPDAELMEIDGITASDVVEIRRLQQANVEGGRLSGGIGVTGGAPLAPAVPGEGGDAMRTGLTEPGPDVAFANPGNAGDAAAPPAPANETVGKGKGKGKAGKGTGDAGAAGGTPPAGNPPPGNPPANA